MKTALHELVLAAGCALSALCWYGTAAAHAVADQPSSDRVLAVVEPGPTMARGFVDLSADRHVLYVGGAKDGHFGNRSGEMAQTQLSIYDVAEPASPHLLSVLPLGDIWIWQVVASGERLLIQHGWDDPKRPFGVTVIDVHDPSHPVVTGNVAVSGDLALSQDRTIAQISSLRPEKRQVAFRLDWPDRSIAGDQVPRDLEIVQRQAEPFPG